MAAEGKITWRKAIVSTYLRRKSLSIGKPYTVVQVGQGTDFLLRNGLLCYLQGNLIHILDIHNTDEIELVFNLDIILQAWTQKLGSAARAKLLHFQDGALTISVTAQRNQRIMVLDAKRRVAAEQRVLAALPVPYGREMIFRNDFKCLVIGKRENGDDGNREWRFWTCDLTVGRNSGQSLKHLCRIPSFESQGEIGTSLNIEIIDGYLWLMTSDITPDPEGLDPISYYGGFRYCLRGPRRRRCWRFQRRRQNEGPIHNHWTNLSLSRAENGLYLVVEARKEWLTENPDYAERSFYTMDFEPTDGDETNMMTSVDEEQEIEAIRESHLTEAKNIEDRIPDEELEYFETLLGILPDHLFAPWPHSGRRRHCEYSRITSKFGPSQSLSHPAQAFSLSDTRFRRYDAATSTFLELVNVSKPAVESSKAVPELRLRSGSKGNDIRLWPSLDLRCPASLQCLLRPESLATFRAIADERCIVYGSRTNKTAPIVLISFDPSLHHGPLLETRARDALSSKENHAGGLQAEDEQTRCEYMASGRDKVSPADTSNLPLSRSTYSASAGEYSAPWTNKLAWWRRPANLLY